MLAYVLGSAKPAGATAPVPCILKLEKTPYAPGEVEALTSSTAWSRIDTASLGKMLYGRKADES